MDTPQSTYRHNLSRQASKTRIRKNDPDPMEKPISLSLTQPQIVDKKLFMLRLGLGILLIILILVFGYISFYLLREYESRFFHKVFELAVDHLKSSIDTNLKVVLGVGRTVDHIHEYILKNQPTSNPPNVTIFDFDEIMTPLLNISSASAIFFIPILHKKTWKGWEKYAKDTAPLMNLPKSMLASSNGSWTIANGIFSWRNGVKVYSSQSQTDSGSPEILTPVWQIYPMSTSLSTIMFDIHSSDDHRTAIDLVIATRKPALTGVVPGFFPKDATQRPSTVLYSPIYSPSRDSYWALSGIVLSWETILRGVSPYSESGLTCVIESPTGTYSYKLVDGRVELIGEGDHHDTDFNNERCDITSSLTSLQQVTSSGFRIYVFPNHDLYKQYVTSTPVITAVSMVAIVVFAACVIVLYDFVLRRRVRSFEYAVASSTKISQLAMNELEVKKNFVRYISHEIRTPLNTVNMGLEVLRQDLLQHSSSLNHKEVHTHLSEIKESCCAALEVVNDFLLFDKIVSDSLELELRPMNVYKFVTDACHPFYIQAKQKGINLQVQHELSLLDSGKTLNISCDKHKLTQVMRNLLSNALKFTPREGMVTVRVSRSDRVISASQKPLNKGKNRMSSFVIDVIDTGAGISLDNQKKLFKEVVQFNPGELQEGGGSGLGLFISHGIAKQHGGSISIFSEGEGHGSTFSLELPVLISSKIFSEYTPHALIRLWSNGIFRGLESKDPAAAASSLRESRSPVQKRAEIKTDKPVEQHADDITSFQDLEDVDGSMPGRRDKESINLEQQLKPLAQSPSQRLILTFHGAPSSSRRILVGNESVSAANSTDSSECVTKVPFTSNWMYVDEKSTATSEDVCNILVVDDVTMNRKMLCRMLTRLPWQSQEPSTENKQESMELMNCHENLSRQPAVSSRKKYNCFEAVDGLDALEKVQATLRNNTPTKHPIDDSVSRFRELGARRERLEPDRYHVLIIDYCMPRMNGPNAVSEIRALGYRGLVIGATGHTDGKEQDWFKSMGADFVLTKPLDIGILTTILQTL